MTMLEGSFLLTKIIELMDEFIIEQQVKVGKRNILNFAITD